MAVKEVDSLSADRLSDRPSKIKARRLYIEGDGVWVKQSTPNKKGKSVELSHFVVHTGSKTGKRNILKDKFEVISTHGKLQVQVSHPDKPVSACCN